MTGYALDSSWHAERERLDSLTSLYDPRTLALCERLGLRPGWRCLDVGAGTGSLARRLARRVAPTGKVVALDVDTRFLVPFAGEDLEVVEADVTSEPLPPGRSTSCTRGWSSSTCRSATRSWARSPARCARAAGCSWRTSTGRRPGSWTRRRRCMRASWRRARRSSPGTPTTRTTAAGSPPAAAAGLVEVGCHAESVKVRADAERGVPQWDLLVAQLAPGLLASGLVEGTELTRFHALMRDGDTICFAPLMVSAYGRRS